MKAQDSPADYVLAGMVGAEALDLVFALPESLDGRDHIEASVAVSGFYVPMSSSPCVHLPPLETYRASLRAPVSAQRASRRSC